MVKSCPLDNHLSPYLIIIEKKKYINSAHILGIYNIYGP